MEDEESLFKELEEEDDHETYQFRERRFQEIQDEYGPVSQISKLLIVYCSSLKSFSNLQTVKAAEYARKRTWLVCRAFDRERTDETHYYVQIRRGSLFPQGFSTM